MRRQMASRHGVDPQRWTPDQFEIIAIPPPVRRGWIAELLLYIVTLPWSLWGGDAVSQWDDATRVVVRYRGRERLLFGVASFDEAKVKVERVAREYEEMESAEWRKRYRVPDDFFDDPKA
jgi:hypothetical protein